MKSPRRPEPFDAAQDRPVEGMRIVITGAGGQLGRSLQEILTDEQILPLTHADGNVTRTQIIDQIASWQPNVVIHAASMTDVDGCERNPDAAFRANALGTRNVALACQRADAAMLYVSTDYVFDGTKDSPYTEWDTPNPINVYGASKLAGEDYVKQLLDRFWIVRTAWLYRRGHKNFVATILRLAAERDRLSIVATEVGSPTYAPDLAAAISDLIRQSLYGTYHLTNAGHCSRYEFARKIVELAGLNTIIEPTDHYPRAAQPPAYAPLRNFVGAEAGIELRSWEEGLQAYFEDSRC
ncbi:MAG: dTDP-4-dehydrorhamnose reductase [Anaerolineae bacterium]